MTKTTFVACSPAQRFRCLYFSLWPRFGFVFFLFVEKQLPRVCSETMSAFVLAVQKPAEIFINGIIHNNSALLHSYTSKTEGLNASNVVRIIAAMFRKKCRIHCCWSEDRADSSAAARAAFPLIFHPQVSTHSCSTSQEIIFHQLVVSNWSWKSDWLQKPLNAGTGNQTFLSFSQV